MVFNPPVAKECKYCGKPLDQWYADIGVCSSCLDTFNEDDYQTYNGADDCKIDEDYY